jgi:hypothetical protein
MGAYEHALKYAQERLQFGSRSARSSSLPLRANAWWLAQHSSRTKASLPTSKRRFPRRSPWPRCARRFPGRESCSAACQLMGARNCEAAGRKCASATLRLNAMRLDLKALLSIS